MPRYAILLRKVEMLGILKKLAAFAFHFTTATYLLYPMADYIFRGGDWLLPYEAALCTGISAVFYIKSGMNVRGIFK